MNRLLAVGQQSPRRAPFPSGFFTPSRGPGGSRAGAHLRSNTHPRLHHFSDSSRSRPPSSKNGSGNGRGPAKAAATAPVQRKGPIKTRVISIHDAEPHQPDQTEKSSLVFEPPTWAALQEPSIPASIVPEPILNAHPRQISIDSFFAGHRPLLEITVPPTERRRASEPRTMAIVGEPEEDEVSMESDYYSVGEHDPYLIAEPEGADPEWAEGTDKHLAELDHTVPPPVPSPSEPLPANGRSRRSFPKVTLKPSERQKNIDFLFPFQAEERKLAEESQKAYRAPRRFPHTVDTYGGSLRGSSKGPAGQVNKFLTTHLVKNEWKAIWDWEKVRKALDSAQQQAKGKGKDVSGQVDEAGLVQSVDRLRQTARATQRARARSKRSHRSASVGMQDAMQFAQMLLGGKGPGKVMIVEMPGPGKGASGQARDMTEHVRREIKSATDEIKRAIRNSSRFSDFFDKSYQTASGVPASDADFDVEVLSVEEISMDEAAEFGSRARKEEKTDMEEEYEEHDSGPLNLRGVTGPRTGIVQASRGRALRRTLRERLAERGVHLVGRQGRISMDSVKRKRRKRISRHKYKKRRKASRAERRRK